MGGGGCDSLKDGRTDGRSRPQTLPLISAASPSPAVATCCITKTLTRLGLARVWSSNSGLGDVEHLPLSCDRWTWLMLFSMR